MSDIETAPQADEALALRAHAGKLRDLSLQTRNPLKVIWLSLMAHRYEGMARDLLHTPPSRS